MSSANCAIVGCSSNTKKLKKWKESNCKIHKVLIKDCVCIYNPRYGLFKFPSILTNEKRRNKWIGQLRQENQEKTT